MNRLFGTLTLLCAAGTLLFGQSNAELMTPAAMSAKAGELARSGKTDAALPLYMDALAKDPSNVEIRLD
jgi:hypothetical protein